MSGSRASSATFICGLILAASGLISPPVALAGGIAYGLIFLNPYRTATGQISRWLLQISVVGLGFGMSPGEVVRIGRSGLVYTTVTIVGAIVLGLFIGRLARVERRPAFLITVGTAICGGSAIAAVAPITNATDDETAVSLSTVFVLNSIALMLFPLVGWSLHLNQTQFGLCAALAIRDTSSVVGATAKYGSIALAVRTTVKLARALWIVPVSAGTAILAPRSDDRVGRSKAPSVAALF